MKQLPLALLTLLSLTPPAKSSLAAAVSPNPPPAPAFLGDFEERRYQLKSSDSSRRRVGTAHPWGNSFSAVALPAMQGQQNRAVRADAIHNLQEIELKLAATAGPLETPQAAPQPIAQRDPRLPPPQDILPPREPIAPPEPALPPPLPPPDQLLTPPTGAPPGPELPFEDLGTEDTLVIERFDVVGSTVFSLEELAEVTAPYTQRPITFAEILAARAAVTDLYLANGYATSGAIFPPQRLENGVATIQVIEGSVETIEVSGTQRLNPGYVSSRLGLTVSPPLNVDRLLEGLQLLQLDPLIETISADLQAGTTPGTNRLVVAVKEADSFQMTAALDNNSPPSVGSVQRQIGFTEANLLGLGDGLTLQYINTDGSNEINASYTVPLSPRNATLSFSANLSESRVITPEFEVLQISSSSREFALSFQQPVVQTPTQGLTLGLTLGYNTSQTRLGFDDIGPFPLSPGADSQGRTTVTTLSFSQSWTDRSTQQVFSAFSQFNLGLGLLGATVNEIGPDSQYFSWQGQAQWVRLLAADTLLLLRGSTQLASAPLLSQEQFGLGGQLTVRGYPQDVLLTDSGLQGTAEVRLPIMRVPELAGLLQITPFLDAGYGWNVRGANPNPNTLIGIGAGLLWQQPNLFARLDWGIPLTTVSGSKSTLQENGLYFSLSYSFL